MFSMGWGSILQQDTLKSKHTKSTGKIVKRLKTIAAMAPASLLTKDVNPKGQFLEQ